MRTDFCSSFSCATLVKLRLSFGSNMSVAAMLAGALPNTAYSTPTAAPLLMPACVALGGVVTVHVAVADRGHRPPRVVVELGVPVDDEAVPERHAEQRMQP